MERFSTTLASATLEKEPDAIVKLAYANFIREPLRTFARDSGGPDGRADHGRHESDAGAAGPPK